MKRADFFDRLVIFSADMLTRRKQKSLRAKMKQQERHPVLDWAYAILWAACVVLVINQYIFQNYRIPSGSMENTLLVGDMLFVDKLSYGPELLPGVLKTPGISKPHRGNIIIFENPSYLSRGPVYTVFQQLLYMVTFTLVDIDREPTGEPRVHYLIKRAIGVEGDTLRVRDGEVFIKPRGSPDFFDERTLMTALALPVKTQRLVASSEYPEIDKVGVASAYSELNLPFPASLGTPSVQSANKDAFQYDMSRVTTLRDANPSNARNAQLAQRYGNGWFIADSRIFPMGDNRDNSRDGRYFGPVAEKKVLGHALFIYFPFSRIGGVR
jgi:signal peptidase I